MSEQNAPANSLSRASGDATDHEPDHDDGCMCDWPQDCDGSGMMSCEGCGGDLCVCVCGGESECYGCEMCMYDDNPDDWPDDSHSDARTEAPRQQVTEPAQCGSVTPETPTP